MPWKPLGNCDPTALGDARLQSHHAAQLITRIARGYLPPAADDSHTNLGWDEASASLSGRPVTVDSGQFDLSLRVEDLTLLWRGAEGGVPERFPLDDRSLDDASAWIRDKLESLGLDPAPFDAPLHFEIPPHPVAEGSVFSVGDGKALAELSFYFGNAAAVIDGIRREQPGASEVRCWPHHFDIAILMTLSGEGEDARTIGFGLSPGDDTYPQPYFYINPWPSPDPAALPKPAPGCHWHTRGWTGAVIIAERLVDLPAATQQALVTDYATQTITALRAL